MVETLQDRHNSECLVDASSVDKPFHGDYTKTFLLRFVCKTSGCLEDLRHDQGLL